MVGRPCPKVAFIKVGLGQTDPTNTVFKNQDIFMMSDSPPFLRGYRVLRIPIIDESGASAWPAVFPIAKIDDLRAAVGARYFASQMMLSFISADRARLDPDALRFYDGEFDARTAKIFPSFGGVPAPVSRGGEGSCEVLEELQQPSPSISLSRNCHPSEGGESITGVACYWDPSSARTGADGSVIVIVFRDDKNRRAFIHDIKYLAADNDDLHPFATQCGRVLDFLTRHDQRHLAIEVNGIGNALPEIMRNVAAARGRPVAIQKIVSHQSKEKRILDAIEPLLSTGRLFAHERIRRTKLMTEMEEWMPDIGGNHDDGIDAIAGALMAAPIAVRPRGQMFLPLSAGTEFKV
ncbi:MAG: hypothetical protein FWC51_00555 [Proteobacteria bacterium]|nr:hypothetical protein [Pseudomonadota bacterium]